MRGIGIGIVVCALLAIAAEEKVYLDVRVPDGRTQDARRACHDVTSLRLRIVGGEFVVDVLMAKPLAESMFLAATIEFDADDRKTTGIDGFDFGIHSFVGSRYRRSRPDTDATGPMARRNTGLKFIPKGQKNPTQFVHTVREGLAPPVVDGNRLQFRFPLAFFQKHGLRYNAQVRWRFFAESTISEHPISTEYLCADEGIPIRIDGRPQDWPPLGVRVADDTGELHPDATEIDIESLQVEHDAKHLFALVRLHGSGFGTSSGEGDVVDRDEVVVAIEPVGARAYMEFAEGIAITTEREGSSPRHRHRAGPRFVEFAFPRAPEQGKFRVLAYADARRFDYVSYAEPATLTIPSAAWNHEDDD